MATTDVETLARQAAQDLAGPGSLVEVSVSAGEDWTNQPAYFFTFDIQTGPAFSFPPGLFEIRLIQKLLDSLLAHGDAHYPFIDRLDIHSAVLADGA